MLHADLNLADLIIDHWYEFKKRIRIYLNYLQEKDENSIVKQFLKISVELHHNGQNSFYSSLKKMTDYNIIISQALIVIN